MKCPRCGKPAECDEVDNGVGMQQCGPYYCQPCDWVQPDPLEELLTKAPAPACKTCGSAKVDENGRLLHWATCPEGSKPACKTCGDMKVVGHAHLVNGSDYRVKPCPDCTPTKEEKP